MTDLATMLINDERIEIAKKMLRRGTPIEYVTEDTGLDADTIQRLQAEMNNE